MRVIQISVIIQLQKLYCICDGVNTNRFMSDLKKKKGGGYVVLLPRYVVYYFGRMATLIV